MLHDIIYVYFCKYFTPGDTASTWYRIMQDHSFKRSIFYIDSNIREHTIGLINWLRPKGLRVCSYVEKQVRIQRGGQGVRTPPPPLENHKLYGFL